MPFDRYTPKLPSLLISGHLYRILNSPVFPVTVWAALFGVQLGITILGVWKRWRPRPRELTGFEKVLNGECIQGWRVGLSKSAICKMCDHRIGEYWIVPPWQTFTADPNTSSDSMSVFISTIHMLPDGRELFELRQQSLVTDDVVRVVLQLVYGDEWSFSMAKHLTPRVIAIEFAQFTTGRHRVTLLDIVTRTHRTITMESPVRRAFMCGLRQGTLEQGTLEAVFSHLILVEVDDGFQIRGEFIVASYKIPSEGEIDTVPVKPQPWQSITFPLHHVSGLRIDGLVEFNPMTFILYYDIEGAGPDHRIFTLDEINGWRIDSVGSWVASLQSSPYTAAILAAAESICQLSVPSMGYRYFPPPVRHFNNLELHHVGGAILYMTHTHGVLQRLVCPPTLKRLAAEALYKSKVPIIDHSKLKQLSGVDIFDGMTSKDEVPVQVTYF